MSAKHALLGLLLHKPAYGYELADRLQARLGPAWAINSGQVSQTLRQMEAEGLIARVDGTAGVHAKRRFFAINESGLEEFEQWFASDTTAARLTRRPLLVKVTLAGPDRLKDSLEQIDAYELDCAEQLKELSRMFREVPEDGSQVRADHVLLRLGLTADIFQLEGELAWARHAHEMVSWLMERDAIWPSANERLDALSDAARERRDARAELFRRMAARELRSISDSEADNG